MATTVKITETYDMKTSIGKIGLIGIHTPTDAQLRNLYPGLMKNHKFIRFLKCDVVGACASVLPADPLQVGVSAGDVAPEDMFNPILYKAVTNTSFDTLVARIWNLSQAGSLGSVSSGDVNQNAADSFQIYYALLSENGRFRKSMPQAGFSIRNLVPICHTLISTFGNVAKPGNFIVDSPIGDDQTEDKNVSNVADVPIVGDNLNDYTPSRFDGDAIVFRGRSVKMPKIPLHYNTEGLSNVFGINVPKTYVACLIIPPAKLHEFYYRMRVTWTIRFETPISSLAVAGPNGMKSVGSIGYYTNYSFSKSETDLPEKSDTVDADGVEINKIMES